MPDSGWLEALLDESVRMGAAVAIILCGLAAGVFFLVNLKWPLVVSYRVHKEQLEAATKQLENYRTDAAADIAAAREDAAGQVAAARAEMNHRMANLRADYQARIEQSEAAWNLMLSEAKRYADGWSAAYHIEAEASKTSEARMDEVVEGMRLVVGLVQALQNQAQQRQLPGS